MSNSEVAQHIAHGATVVTTGAGFYKILAENTGLITITIMVLSFLTALTFYILNYQLNRKRLLLAIESAEQSGAERRLSGEDLLEVKTLLSKHRRGQQ